MTSPAILRILVETPLFMGRLIPGAVVLLLALGFLPSCVKHAVIYPEPIDTIPALPSNGAQFYTGPSHPPPVTGNVGDFYLDVSDSLIYGPKKAHYGWGSPVQLPSEPAPDGAGGDCTIYWGHGFPQTNIGIPGDYYLDLSGATLYGPKSINGWGVGTLLTNNGDTTTIAAPAPPTNVQ